MQLAREADQTDFVKHLKSAVLVKIHRIKTSIRVVTTKEVTKAINVPPLLNPEGSVCGYWGGAAASRPHPPHRIRVPGEGDGWFDEEQLPPAAAPRPPAAGEQQPLRNPLGPHTAPPATPLLTGGRRCRVLRGAAKCSWKGWRCRGNQARAGTALCGVICTWITHQEICNHLAVPLAHDKQLLRHYTALPRSRRRMRDPRVASISPS